MGQLEFPFVVRIGHAMRALDPPPRTHATGQMGMAGQPAPPPGAPPQMAAQGQMGLGPAGQCHAPAALPKSMPAAMAQSAPMAGVGAAAGAPGFVTGKGPLCC